MDRCLVCDLPDSRAHQVLEQAALAAHACEYTHTWRHAHTQAPTRPHTGTYARTGPAHCTCPSNIKNWKQKFGPAFCRCVAPPTHTLHATRLWVGAAPRVQDLRTAVDMCCATRAVLCCAPRMQDLRAAVDMCCATRAVLCCAPRVQGLRTAADMCCATRAVLCCAPRVQDLRTAVDMCCATRAVLCCAPRVQDLRTAVDMCHRDGSLKKSVAADPAKYIHHVSVHKGLHARTNTHTRARACTLVHRCYACILVHRCHARTLVHRSATHARTSKNTSAWLGGRGRREALTLEPESALIHRTMCSPFARKSVADALHRSACSRLAC